jgi:hypothetical protein
MGEGILLRNKTDWGGELNRICRAHVQQTLFLPLAGRQHMQHKNRAGLPTHRAAGV